MVAYQDDLPSAIKDVLHYGKQRIYEDTKESQANYYISRENLSKFIPVLTKSFSVGIIDDMFSFRQWLKDTLSNMKADEVVGVLEDSNIDHKVREIIEDIILAEFLSEHIYNLLSRDSINWGILDTILSHATISWRVANHLKDRLDRDEEMRIKMIALLCSCPMDYEFWLPSYCIDSSDGKRNLEYASEEWCKSCKEGRIKYFDSFYPTHYNPIPFLALLFKWDKKKYFDVIDRLPLPQIAEMLIVSSCEKTSDSLELLIDIPAYYPPKVHPALPVTVTIVLHRITDIRSELNSARRGVLNQEGKTSVDTAIHRFSEWRDDWINNVLDVICARDDHHLVLAQLLGISIDALIWFDSLDRYDQDVVEDKKTIVWLIANRLDLVPTPLWDPPEQGNIDGHIASWLINTWKSYDENGEDFLEPEEAETLWDTLISLIPKQPTGILRGVYTPRPLSNWMNGIIAAVLRDTSNPIEAWKTLWDKCSPLRGYLEEDDIELYGKVKTNALILVIGWLAVYGIYQKSGKSFEDLLEKFWFLLEKSSVSFFKATRFPTIVGADIGIKAGVLLATQIPDSLRRISTLQKATKDHKKLHEWIAGIIKGVEDEK